jgi:polysaccharide chain length determinant protein (PEP-CTERM system associated)
MAEARRDAIAAASAVFRPASLGYGNGMSDLQQQLRTLLRQLWRKRWLIVPTAWVIAIAGWAIVMALPNRYESQARIYVDADTLLSPLLRGISVEGNVTQQVDIMQRTLLSRPNVEKLIRLADLDLSVNTSPQREALIAELTKGVQLRVQGRNLFTLAYQDKDAARAQRIVQSLLTIFVETNVGNNRADIDKARSFLDQQIGDYERQLRTAEARLATFKQSNIGVLGSTGTYNERLEAARLRLTELKAEMEDALSRREAMRRELAGIPQFVQVDAPGTMVSMTGERLSPALQSLQSRIDDAEKQLDALQQRYTEQHPDVVTMKRTLASLREQYAQKSAEEKRTPTGGGRPSKTSIPNTLYEQIKLKLVDLETTYDAIRRRYDNTTEELRRLEGLANQAPRIEAEFQNLNRDYGAIKKSYEELVSRRESAKITDAVETRGEKLQFRIVDPPTLPTTPSAPPRLILASAVLGIALAAGAGIAFVLSRFDDSFDSVAALKAAIALPVIGTVTSLLTAADRRRRLFDAGAFVASLAVLVMVYGCLAAYLTKRLPFVT